MAFFYLLDKKGKYATNVMVVIRNIFYGLVAAGVLFGILILVLSAKGKLSGVLLTISEKIPYLAWGDQWGNGRGFTWSITGKMIMEMNPFHKLFGVGPDHFAGYAYSLYEEELNWKWGNNVLTNAHNEWVNMIVDYGFLGAAAYIGFFLSALVRFVKTAKTVRCFYVLRAALYPIWVTTCSVTSRCSARRFFFGYRTCGVSAPPESRS